MQSAEESALIDARSYAESYGVSVDEALSRFDQHDSLGLVATELQNSFPEQYGGIVTDDGADYRMTVRWVGQANLSEAVEIESRLNSSGARIHFDTTAKMTAADGVELTDKIVLSPELADQVGMYFDPATESVIYHVYEGAVARLVGGDSREEGGLDALLLSAQREAEDALGLPYSAVEVELKSGEPTLTDSGGYVTYEPCTTGFSVLYNYTIEGLTTAGHCSDSQGL